MPTLQTYPSVDSVAEAFVNHLIQSIPRADEPDLHVCLSGGSTPKRMFEILARDHRDQNWSNVHFYWGDERCVAPDDSESNFGVARDLFLVPCGVPEKNIHRVIGEIEPAQAARQYEAKLKEHVPMVNDVPQFDLMILGMGDDGHTASIFPHQMELIESERICEVATHPQSQQNRVTITGKVIRGAKQICFLVTGAAKAEVLSQILEQADNARRFPTSHFCFAGNVVFFLDQAAASNLPASK